MRRGGLVAFPGGGSGNRRREASFTLPCDANRFTACHLLLISSASVIRRTSLALLGILGIALVACGSDDEQDAQPVVSVVGDQVVIEGTILEMARGPAAMIVEDEAGRLWSVSVAGSPTIIAERGGSQLDLIPGFPVAVHGERTGGDRVRADTVRVLGSPAVVLTRPRPGIGLTRPLIPVSGHARRGTQPSYRLMSGDEVLKEGRFRSEAFGARPYGAFSAELVLPRFDVDQPLVLEVWVEGSDDEAIRRTVQFARERSLTLYYPSRTANPERTRCDAVYPAIRPAPVLMAPDSIVTMLMDDPPAASGARGMYSELGQIGQLRDVSMGDDRIVVTIAVAGEEPDECSLQLATAQVERTLQEAYGVSTVRLEIRPD